MTRIRTGIAHHRTWWLLVTRDLYAIVAATLVFAARRRTVDRPFESTVLGS